MAGAFLRGTVPAVPGKPPTEWKTVRVDLWAASKGKPERVWQLSLLAVGCGAAFDQIAYVSQPRDKFRIVKVGGFDYSFQVTGTTKMVSFPSTTTTDTTLASVKQLSSGSMGAHQGWFINPTGTGYFRICGSETFQCLSVGSNTSGALVQGRPSAGTGAAFEWNIILAN